VHVADKAAAEKLAVFDPLADKLAAAFWPGPMTLVLPLRENADVAAAVTAGLPTIAIRCPAHPVMREVLIKSRLNLAAPSANRSGGISPTIAAHVVASLGVSVPLIVDGGACEAGLESTIIAVRENGWQVLRPGPVTAKSIADVAKVAELTLTDKSIEAPGQLASHYAPSKPVRLNAAIAEADEWHIGFNGIAGVDNLSEHGDLAEAATQLFAALHRAEAGNLARIAIAPIPFDGIGTAINDRLSRAAAR
jgi:L-threonylcarbamoyladenylate synthase